MKNKILKISFLIISVILINQPVFSAGNKAGRKILNFGWAPSGNKWLVQSKPKKLDVYKTNGKNILSITKKVTHAAFSPDGNNLGYVVPKEGVYSYSFESKSTKLIKAVQSGEKINGEIHWSSDSNKLLICSSQETDKDSIFEFEVFDKNGQKLNSRIRKTKSKKTISNKWANKSAVDQRDRSGDPAPRDYDSLIAAPVKGQGGRTGWEAE